MQQTDLIYIRRFLIGVLCMVVAGCRGIAVQHVYPEGQGLTPLNSTAEVYLTREKQIPECSITKIADIRVASKAYGGAARVNKAMRAQARSKGGNAVIGYNFWIAPNGFAWAAPQCEGTVVQADLNCLRRHTTPEDDNPSP